MPEISQVVMKIKHSSPSFQCEGQITLVKDDILNAQVEFSQEVNQNTTLHARWKIQKHTQEEDSYDYELRTEEVKEVEGYKLRRTTRAFYKLEEPKSKFIKELIALAVEDRLQDWQERFKKMLNSAKHVKSFRVYSLYNPEREICWKPEPVEISEEESPNLSALMEELFQNPNVESVLSLIRKEVSAS